jgi:polysaccharide export outer membrane protein
MRIARFLLPLTAAFAVVACARQQPYSVTDAQTGQPAAQQFSAPAQYPEPRYAERRNGTPAYAQNERGLYNTLPPSTDVPAQYGGQPQNAEPPPGGRGLFNSRVGAPPSYGQPMPAQYRQPAPVPSYVLQYRPPASPAAAGAYAAAPAGAAPYAAPAAYTAPAYTLDSGDKVRVSVFGQDGISGSYLVDAGGNVNLPLIGGVAARGYTTRELAATIAERLRRGYVREPHVTVAIEAYRPFFILGEVTTPGQYPYVPNMTVENAVAIGGGFSPRAKKTTVELTRVAANGQRFTGEVPLNYPLQPGDTIVVKERWF